MEEVLLRITEEQTITEDNDRNIQIAEQQAEAVNLSRQSPESKTSPEKEQVDKGY